MMWRDSGEPVDTYYQIRPECDDVPKTRFKIKAGKTLSVRRWQAAFSSAGYLDIGSTLSRIQRGGVHPSIRGEVWEFLLGCFDPKSSSEERMQLRQQRRVQYAHWKEECRKLDSHVGSGTIITAPIITEDGEPIKDPLVLMQAIPSANSDGSDGAKGGKFDEHITDQKVIQWKLTLHQIGLDVLRTDRSLVFYEKQENLAKLWDILAIYAWIDIDVGYCQGMSDICSPMIMLLLDEADAFWCFERLMRRLRGNFRCTEQSVGVENQLQSLASITQVLDPKLHQHLEPESLNEKKEGSKEKVKSIRQFGKYEQENMKNGGKGSETPLPISVFLVASVLKEKSDKLLQEARGLDDVVKILNDIAGNLDAKKACSGAMKLHKKYLKKAKKP